MTLTEMGRRAKDVSRVLNTLGSREKNMGLEEAARALLDSEEEIDVYKRQEKERSKLLEGIWFPSMMDVYHYLESYTS